MQPPDVGKKLPDRIMLVPKIINEDRDARFILVQYAAERLALAALICVDRRRDTHRLQLRCARFGTMVEQIGQYHHIGNFV